MIDFHSHVFADGTEIGIEPDLSFIPQGVTTAVDAGSTGIANFECFKKDVIQRSKMRIKAFVNLCPAGLATMKYHEYVEPSCWDVGRLRDVLTEHHDILLGLKIRISKEIVGDLGINVLKQAVNVAEKLGTRLAVHVTNPPEAMETVVKLLRPEDVLAHCYHGTGSPPSGISTLITSAPKSAINPAANGAAITVEISKTLIPSNNFILILLS